MKSGPVIPAIVLLLIFSQPLAIGSSLHKNPFDKELSRKYIRIGAVLAAEGLLFAFDKDISNLSQNSRLHGRDADILFRHVEHLGRGGPYAIAVPLFAGYGVIFKDRKSLVVSGELLAAYAVAEGVTHLEKKAFGRLRPSESESPYKFFRGGSSFYSGHTISAFTFASVISLNYPGQDLSFIGIDHKVPIVPIMAYTLAGLVGIQRMYGNAHWSSDVFAGAVAGYSFAWLSRSIGNKYFIKPSQKSKFGLSLIGFGIKVN